jgi:hypothetical protein
MRISYIINSAASDPLVNTIGNPWRKVGYRRRYSLLKEQVLPAATAQGFDEVIVAGCFEAGAGYQYVPMEPRFRDRRDALWQREIGARYATGDVLVFGHDDHSLAPDFEKALWDRCMTTDDFAAWDLLIPKRIHGITGAELNNGKDSGYMGGHVLVMKRWLWAQVPWTLVDTSFWDTTLTREWKAAGGKLVYADDLVHVDVEATEDEA